MTIKTDVIYSADIYCTRVYDLEGMFTEEQEEFIKKIFLSKEKPSDEEWKQYEDFLDYIYRHAKYEEYDDDIYYGDLLEETVSEIEE